MQVFLIVDYVDGAPLNMLSLSQQPQDLRKYLFSQLIDIFAELRRLEFTTGGSLMPDPSGGLIPVVGRMFSIPINELQTSPAGQRASALPRLNSTSDFARYQLQIMRELFQLPTPELSRNDAQLEVFALEHLGQQLPKLIDPQEDDNTFVLSHTDMGCRNVLVDSDLNITGIIDWEWACVIPRQLFMPPSWISGIELDIVSFRMHNTTLSEFLQILQDKSQTSPRLCQLAREWNQERLQNEPALPLAHILQDHWCLITVYFVFLYQRFFVENYSTLVPTFFQGNRKQQSLALEVERRVKTSEEYAQYLKDKGLFVPSEEAIRDRELLEEIRRLREKLKL
jgi:hypothetical protein